MKESTDRIDPVLPTDEVVEELRLTFDDIGPTDPPPLRAAKIRGIVDAFARVLGVVLNADSVEQAKVHLEKVDQVTHESLDPDGPAVPSAASMHLTDLLNLAFQNARTTGDFARVANHLIARLVEDQPSES